MTSIPTLLKLFSRLTIREWKSAKVRPLLVVISITFGIAMITSMRVSTGMAVTGLLNSLDQKSGNTDLQIIFGTGESAFPETILDDVRSAAGVEAASAVVRSTLWHEETPGEKFELFGVDFLNKSVADLYQIETIELHEPVDIFSTDPTAILVTETYARSKSVGLSDTLFFVSPTGKHEFTIRGIIRATGAAAILDGRLVVMFLPAAQNISGLGDRPETSLVDQIDISVASGFDPQAIRDSLATSLTAGMTVSTVADRQVAYERAVSGLSTTLNGISGFVLLAALFIIYSSTSAAVKAKLPHLATASILGTHTRDLVSLVIFEAAVLGFVGAIVGVLLGVVMAIFTVGDIRSGMSLNYWMSFDQSAPWWTELGAIAGLPFIGMVLSALSAFGPAMRLRSMNALNVKRGEHENVPLREPGMTTYPLIFFGGLTTATGLAILWRQFTSGSSGSVLATVFAFSLIAAIVPYLPIAWRFLDRVVHHRIGPVGRTIVRNLNRGTDRSSVVIGAVAFCVAGSIAAATLPASFLASGNSWYGFFGDVAVSSRLSTGGWLSTALSDRFRQNILDCSAVEVVHELRVIHGQTYRNDRIAVVGLSDRFFQSVQTRASENGDEFLPLTNLPPAALNVLISRSFARRFDVALGEAFEIESPTGSLRVNASHIVDDYTSDTGAVIFPLHVIRSRWNDALTTFFAVDLRESATVGQFSAELSEQTAHDPTLMVTSMNRLRERATSTIHTAFADLDAIQSLVFLVALIGIFDLMLTNIVDRRREISLMRVIGASKRFVRNTVIGESLAIGATGVLLGCAVGALFAILWIQYVYPVLVGYVLDFHLPAIGIGRIIVFSLVAAAASGLIASTWINRKSILRT